MLPLKRGPKETQVDTRAKCYLLQFKTCLKVQTFVLLNGSLCPLNLLPHVAHVTREAS